MSAQSLGFGGEIARQPRATHHILSVGIGYDTKMPCSEILAASHGKRTCVLHVTGRGAAHTDPQILFSAAAS